MNLKHTYMNKYHNNFKGASWYNTSIGYIISLLGAGGIGSNTLFNLARTVQSQIVVFDFDSVEEHNIGSQFFRPIDEGKPKVDALKEILGNVFCQYNINTINRNINDFSNPSQYCSPITIAAFDNMEARKRAFEDWSTLSDRLLFIDGRLRATEYEIFCVVPGMEDKYRETLFDSSDIPDDPCTFKQTTYAGMMIGARITSFIVNFMHNRTEGEDVCSVPFHFKELLELNYMETKEMNDA